MSGRASPPTSHAYVFLRLGSVTHTNPFKRLCSVWVGWGGGMLRGKRSEDRVSMASSQGAGMYSQGANHPVGRSQMRQWAPSSLIPGARQLSKPRYNSKKTTLQARLFPSTPETHPFLQITRDWPAPKTPVLDRFANRRAQPC